MSLLKKGAERMRAVRSAGSCGGGTEMFLARSRWICHSGHDLEEAFFLSDYYDDFTQKVIGGVFVMIVTGEEGKLLLLLSCKTH